MRLWASWSVEFCSRQSWPPIRYSKTCWALQHVTPDKPPQIREQAPLPLSPMSCSRLQQVTSAVTACSFLKTNKTTTSRGRLWPKPFFRVFSQPKDPSYTWARHIDKARLHPANGNICEDPVFLSGLQHSGDIVAVTGDGEVARLLLVIACESLWDLQTSSVDFTIYCILLHCT